jgi:hypothetical protein
MVYIDVSGEIVAVMFLRYGAQIWPPYCHVATLWGPNMLPILPCCYVMGPKYGPHTAMLLRYGAQIWPPYCHVATLWGPDMASILPCCYVMGPRYGPHIAMLLRYGAQIWPPYWRHVGREFFCIRCDGRWQCWPFSIKPECDFRFSWLNGRHRLPLGQNMSGTCDLPVLLVDYT